ncbi:NAD(P)H-hydrate dehydratase [Natranaeroarchaeum aerophilus]|uniref:Bifunctional NAD(P)H-hydrate repair enzyme n=1 Tax=Natranaeroarchaeum aerophilus TaxID=2917711 RepID=A0AAE3FRL6_9EURY|nr:NAD(P)H-hydrate dehydratase [Natranaeroarchaeum aerophilus]MCL9814059.1 NAD(P)H-hydrate dehydratase [Natranaeroarchaeum aerophilus]
MITSERMAAVDANAEALGVPRKQLMESSGNAVAQAVRDVAEPGARVVVVAGRGNNGGDAFVAARFLDGYDVSAHLLGRAETITTDIARENWTALQQGEYEIEEVRDSTQLSLPEADVIVDAMLGTGVTGALREPAASAAEAINTSSGTVVAVDIPSGIDADTGEAAGAAVEADHVVTFHDEKPGLDSVDADVTVADIGIPAAAELFVERGDLRSLSREPESHKGDHGTVLVVGGGPYSGAPALSAQAAFRAGADLVYVATPESVADAVAGYSENLIVEALPGDRLAPVHVDTLLALAEDVDAVLVGPGLGDAEGSLDAVGEFLGQFDGRVVVDADPLRTVPGVETDADLVCTPHQGELAAMGGPREEDWRDRADAVETFAEDIGATLLVKGAHDIVSNGERTRVNRTGNPGMTVGGTGDVLAGITAALVTALDDPVQAAGIAAYANGRAGDLAVEDHGYGLVATELPPLVADALWGDRDE